MTFFNSANKRGFLMRMLKLFGVFTFAAIIVFSVMSCDVSSGVKNGYNPNVCIDCGEIICKCIEDMPPITDGVELTIAMWDSSGDGWDNNAALRININGINQSTNARLENGSGPDYHTFSVNIGDIISFYWVNGGQYDYECAFVVYYSNNPPNPFFDPDSYNWTPYDDPNGRVLIYKQYSYEGSVGNGTQIGSFTTTQTEDEPEVCNDCWNNPCVCVFAPTVGIEVTLDVMNEWELIDQTIQVVTNTNKIFTVNGSYSTYRWYLDGTLVSSSTSYTLNKPNGVYQLMVVVANSSGESRSARCWVTVTSTPLIFPNVPTGVTATATSSNTVTVSWGTVTGATGYRIYRSSSSSGTFSEIGTSTTTSYLNTGLAASTTYYYKVAAYNNNGTGTQSSTVNVTTLSVTGGMILIQSNRTATVNVTAGINGRIPVTVTAPSTGSVTIIGAEGTTNDNDPALYNEAGTRIAYQNNGYNFTYTIPAGQTQTVYAGTGGNVARSYVITATFN